MTDQQTTAQHKLQPSKLARLPPNAKVTKRPLLRPPIPSPYAGAESPKTVYVAAQTPFLAAVKRVERLLRLADRRAVQSATTTVKNRGEKRKRQKTSTEDEIVQIAETVERNRKVVVNGDSGGDGGGGEEVVIKGTGKAVQKALQLGLWFQQRQEYAVTLRTGSVRAIDDVYLDGDHEMKEAEGEKKDKDGMQVEEEEGQREEALDRRTGEDVNTGTGHGDVVEITNINSETVDVAMGLEEETASSRNNRKRRKTNQTRTHEAGLIPETRMRHTSVLEVAVRLR